MTAVIFGSIIWHELGHAWARKKSGAAYSEITLHGFGGLCSGPGTFTRGESIFISAAGPAANLILGGATWLLTLTPGMENMWVRQFVGNMLWLNFALALLNLLPILPLDGGRILESISGPRNFRKVVWCSLILAATLAVLSLTFTGRLFGAVLFGYLAFSNWQLLQGQRTRFR